MNTTIAIAKDTKDTVFKRYENFFYKKKSLELIRLKIENILTSDIAQDYMVDRTVDEAMVDLSLFAPKGAFNAEVEKNDAFFKALNLDNFVVTELAVNSMNNHILITKMLKIHPYELNGMTLVSSLYALKNKETGCLNILLVTKSFVLILSLGFCEFEDYFNKRGIFEFNGDVAEREMFANSVVLYHPESVAEVQNYLSLSN